MFTLNFAFRNITSRKSSIVIILFIAFSIAVMVMANAVFDGTGNGIEKTFSSSFTGDIVVKPKTDFPMSLFGDETPVTGELSELPRLIPYNIINDYVKSLSEIQYMTPQLTGQAVLKIESKNKLAVLFGVETNSYLKIMTAIKILEGKPFELGEKGVMLSDRMKESLEKSTGKQLSVGDELQFISSNGSSYTLRAVPLTAVYKYEVHNDLQDNIVLIDPDTLRSLLGIESMSSAEIQIDEDKTTLIENSAAEDIDSLFSDDLFGEDSGMEESAEEVPAVIVTEQIVEKNLSEIEESEQTTWNYIICKVVDGANPDSIVKKMNKYFKEKEFEVTASSWRAAAGMSAQYIYWMRLIFNVGLILLIGTGFIVVNNTLIIAAMDRTKETGALRAIGAGRKFIAVEYLLETLMLTITAGILGCILGIIGNQILVLMHITFSNTYLVQLFGGTELETTVTFSNICSGMILSLLLAVIGWLYPVHIALDTSPVVAMEHI
ncbi:MAG: FtsX-like permease family protein [Treponema sp.]|uniref:ABC transporter permease n=1 Tax=Treponema sp. TaxID=166 RepID=UPI001B69A976|nr:FtsX-like permease family protein [Treponema sp.]MBP5403430.1 FtsX-like permease family protein [Treponema sp.]MBR5933535.1 FtsX-like permease family protein [Treponema sp.]